MKPTTLAIFTVWISTGGLHAQETERPLTPLQIVISLAPAPDGSDAGMSLALHVLADSGTPTLLRSGREVAVPAADNQYRNVGTNVTCRAQTSGSGFRVELDLERSSLPEGSDPGRPSFQTFSYHTSFRLRDGESVELASGAGLRSIVARLEVLTN
jgi:hypothetical protein